MTSPRKRTGRVKPGVSGANAGNATRPVAQARVTGGRGGNGVEITIARCAGLALVAGATRHSPSLVPGFMLAVRFADFAAAGFTPVRRH